MKRITGILLISVLVILSVSTPVFAVDVEKQGEFSVLMDNLIANVGNLEKAYSPMGGSNIARTMRLEEYNRIYPEITRYIDAASVRTDSNSMRLKELGDTIVQMDASELEIFPLLEEFHVRSTVLECELRSIDPEVVADFVLTEFSTFVADNGDFTHPDFDFESVADADLTNIFFCGFGLVVLLNMDNGSGEGVAQAVRLYETASQMKSFLGNQFVLRSTDLDTVGLPLLEAILFDTEVPPDVQEIYYSVIAELVATGKNSYGADLVLSDAWYSKVLSWVADHIKLQDRLDARESVGFPYGVSFGYRGYSPEALLGMTGLNAVNEIRAMLSSDDMMLNIAGLEAFRWFDTGKYQNEADELFTMAEANLWDTDFAAAMLALEAFDRDAKYTGEQYSPSRKLRLSENLPGLCDLMSRAMDAEWIEYVWSESWSNIFNEGSMVDELEPCLPMIAQVVVSDRAAKEAGQDRELPVAELEILTYFLPQHPEIFETTSEAVLGFLTDELDNGTLNQFSVWDYVEYLVAADNRGAGLPDEWSGTVERLREWADSQTLLIRGDDLKNDLTSL